MYGLLACAYPDRVSPPHRRSAPIFICLSGIWEPLSPPVTLGINQRLAMRLSVAHAMFVCNRSEREDRRAQCQHAGTPFSSSTARSKIYSKRLDRAGRAAAELGQRHLANPRWLFVAGHVRRTCEVRWRQVYGLQFRQYAGIEGQPDSVAV